MTKLTAVRLAGIGALSALAIAISITSASSQSIRQGPNYYHVLPAGWQVVEEGNHALVLRSRDMSAGIINYGLSGINQAMNPQTLAYQIMTSALHLPRDMRVLSSAPIRPLPPYTEAAIMEVTYTNQNGPLRGYVISNVVNVYRRTDGMITLAAAKQQLWSAYADWLPPLAMMVINTGPNPYGRTQTSMSIQRDVQRLNQAATAYREWSSRTWAEVAQYRAQVQERQSRELGPMLTGQQWYANPYGGQPIRQSTGPAAIWINRNGEQLPTDNPNFDPRTPGDPDWQQLVPTGQ